MLLKKIRSQSDNRRRGLNLTEIAIVLGVVIIVFSAIWLAAGQVMINNSVRVATQQLVAIAQNARVVFAERGAYGTPAAATTALDKLRVFPVEMRAIQGAPDGNIFTPWSEPAPAVQVSASTCGVAGAPAGVSALAADTVTPFPCFTVIYRNVPQAACIRLMTNAQVTGIGLQQIYMTTGGGTVLVGDENDVTNPFPISPQRAAPACNNANGAGSNDIFWVFRIKDNR